VGVDKFIPLLHDIWREACKHIELDHSLNSIITILRRCMPLDAVAIIKKDDSANLLEAVYSPELAGSSHLHCGQALSSLQVLHAEVAVALHTAELVKGYPSCLAVTAQSQTGCRIVLLLSAGLSFTLAHVAMARRLAEPLATAIDNDNRFHELQRLRDAALADKRHILQKLGRETVETEIVGLHGGLAAVIERVGSVCVSEVPVLLLGETGSGKEVVARYLHDNSPWKDGPFIRVNCGAIPPELIDSELFGHEKGAFTGAAARRRGWFERANAGTLFLDEIGDLPLSVQVRLLRVLQEGSFERVGGEETVHIHVRLIAATHRDLPNMVGLGQFRADLWYRIASFPILIPPLRERRQDIPELASFFCRKASRRFGLRAVEPLPADIALLCSYSWPGNVREFASVIDRAVLLGNGEHLDFETALGSFPGIGHGKQDLALTHSCSPLAVTNAGGAKGFPTLDEAMAEHIREALRQAHGKVEGARGAATLLGLNPSTLRSRMRKLGIQKNEAT